jgi:nucleotide-binding universal stress UspA family protein
MSALDAPPKLATGTRAADMLLLKVWSEAPRQSLRLLVCAHASPVAEEVLAFAHTLGRLLNGHVSAYSPVVGNDPNCRGLTRVIERNRYDLVILGERQQSFRQRLLSGPDYGKAAKYIDASLLVVRRPRWPLKRLLVVIQGKENDRLALDWAARLAPPSGASVTVLAVLPRVPAMYDRCVRMQQELDTLLTDNSALGLQLRQVTRWQAKWKLEGTLRVRKGIPDEQIYNEVAQVGYDLIVLAAKPHERWWRWLSRDLAVSLLHWADRPVLIAKPTIA